MRVARGGAWVLRAGGGTPTIDALLALLLTAVPACVLLAAALLKLAAPRASQAALATFGLRSQATRAAVWGLTIVVEVMAAAGALAGSDAAAYGAAALSLMSAGVLGAALARGRAGRPCGCFGAGSRVRPAAVVRNLALAAAFVAGAALDREPLSTDEWLAAGLALALVAIAGLSMALLALARQVGELRLAAVPAPALDIPHEGPELGSRTELIDRFPVGARTRYALAVFTSDSCPVCAAVGPAVELLARDPLLAVRSFDEVADADVWRSLDVPGAPYAIAFGLDGTVMAKGTFNTLPQLEGIAAAAERREREAARA